MTELSSKLQETNEGEDYHAISPPAVGSLILGLLSPVVLAGMLLWVIPAIGIGLALLALRSIRRSSGALTGRGVALTGLFLCTLFATAAPAQVLYARHSLAQAARPIVDAWFDFLRHGEPEKALQLTMPAAQRRELNDALWDYYGSAKENRDQLEGFVASPVPRFVLEQGEKCQARFYDANRVATSSSGDTIELIYAVTYPDGPGKKTFFVNVTVDRRPLKEGEVGWRVATNGGGIHPDAPAL
jgi:hypothetical protein